MQKIDKTRILSTAYKHWEESMADNHSRYTSSNSPYYYDVVMSLLACQKGVCAYTERLLCDEQMYDSKNWLEGKYQKAKPEFSGALDHFDPHKKETLGWLWDNFFMVDKDVNDKHKRNKPVDDILKPDLPWYDPFTLLEYDTQLHVFIANTTLEEPIQARINNMIEVLGINLSWVVKLRKSHLTKIFPKIEFEISSWEEEQAANEQYFTAFEMCRQKLA